jgi:UDP-N-acetylglucosamine:LPS N-acetylglucosamine transferase
MATMTTIDSFLHVAKKRILFFSRGKGYGHAVPDMAIANRLCEIDPAIDVTFASYASGALSFRRANLKFIDLGLPESNPLWDTAVAAGRLLTIEKPDLVISHEEFAVGPASRIMGHRSVFITEWFAGQENFRMRALEFYDEIILIERRGTFEEPAYLQNMIYEAGPIIRPFRLHKEDGLIFRTRLGIPEDAILISVFQGGWATESRQPIFALVHAAFRALPIPNKHLVWMAGDDAISIRTLASDAPDITVCGYDPDIEQVMVSTDIAITKANRTTVRELCSLGIPIIALTHRKNRIDDALLPTFDRVCLLDANGVTPTVLADAISSSLKAAALPRATSIEEGMSSGGLNRVVDRLLLHLYR